MEQYWSAMYKKFKTAQRQCQHKERVTEYSFSMMGYAAVEVCTECGDGAPSLIVFVDINPEHNGLW
jgi:hypothetical protein